jgi:stage V sporulation protein D (sporulation-specific penicillin-binding protein)
VINVFPGKTRSKGKRNFFGRGIGLTRLKFISYVVFIAFFILIARLFYWQIVRGKELSILARGQYTSRYTVGASRGDILAADSTWLAASEEAWLVYASLKDLKSSPSEVAEKLAPLFIEIEEVDDQYRATLLKEIDRLKSLLTKSGVVWVPLKHKVDSSIKANIEAMNIEGLGFEPEEMRIYPEGSAAAHLLGFVGKDREAHDIGYFGIEGYYELSLSGKPGFTSYEADASGIPILLGDSKEIEAIGGVGLLTHIDKAVQLVLDKKLLEGIEKYGAVGGTVIVMDPHHGGILGMSSYPSYDPAKYWNFSDEYFSNPAIFSSFEPGSIFKVLIMASALDAGVVEPDTKCDICTEAYKIDKYFIETWDKSYHPNSTMLDVIVNSDNVGMVFVGEKLGIDRMHDYLKSFGIGSLAGVDLQGEVTPKLRDRENWSRVDLATASFGQGVAVTPIQMIKAVSAIANEGVIVTPQVVDKIMGEDWEEDIKPVEEGRVISEKAASETTAMMVEAVDYYEKLWTKKRNFKVAGKTGTAQIPIEGYYDEGKTIASFIGFAPYDNPKFVMLVTLRQPSASQWGAETAAPLWYSIAEELFVYFGMRPEN